MAKKKRQAKPKRRKPIGSATPSPLAIQLIEELDACIRAIGGVLPEQFEILVEEAVRNAAAGDTDLIKHLLITFQETKREHEGFDGNGELEFPLTSRQAAQAFFELEPVENVAEMQKSVVSVLEIDPDAIEILMGLGINAPKVAERVHWFQRASEAAQRKDPDDVSIYMPEYRHEMVTKLIDDGRLSDAAEILLPSLTEDPGDETGARFIAADLLLRLGWDDDLQKVLDTFPDDEIGPLRFAEALLAFRKEGASDRANQLLLGAEAGFPGVSACLCGTAPERSLQREESDDFPRELDASDVSRYLLPGVREIEGAVAWIRETLADRLAPTALTSDAAGLADGAMPWDDPSIDLLGDALDARRIEGEWQLIVQKIDLPDARYAAVVLDDTLIRYTRSFDATPKTRELKDCFLRAVANPIAGRVVKPTCLMVPTKAIHRALTKHCGTLGVNCEHRAVPSSLKGPIGQQLKTIFQVRESDHDPGAELGANQTSLDELPICDETWLLNAVNPPMFIHDGPTPRRGWMVLLAESETGMILMTEVIEEQPTSQQLLDICLKSIRKPLVGASRQPSRLIIAPEAPVEIEWLAKELPGVELKVGDETLSDYFTKMFTEMLLHGGPTETTLRDAEGVDDDQLAELYQTAASFYRVKPWQMVAGDRLFDITCDVWENTTWTGCVMGQLGQELGLGLYDDPSDARAVVQENASDLSRFNSLVIHFGEAHETIAADLWNIERSDWKVARPDGFPFIARIVEGRDLETVSAEDLRVLQAVMQHTPRFLDHPEDEPFHVPYGNTVITFQWVNLD